MSNRKSLFKKAMLNFENVEKKIKQYIKLYAKKEGVTLSKNNFNNILMSTNKIRNLTEKKRHVVKMFFNKKRTHTSESIKRRTGTPMKRKRTSFTSEKSWIARSLQN